MTPILFIAGITLVAWLAYESGRRHGYAQAWRTSIETDQIVAKADTDRAWQNGFDAAMTVKECLRATAR